MSISTAETQSLTGIAVGTRRFSSARRGYDTEEVDEFLARVADRVRELEGEAQRQRATLDLLQRKVTSAQEAAYARVFRQLMEVMRTAEREAARIKVDAEKEAKAILTRAREEASLAKGTPRRASAPAKKAAPKWDPAPPDDLSIDIELLWAKND